MAKTLLKAKAKPATKTKPAKGKARPAKAARKYDSDDVAEANLDADNAYTDAWIERNRDALNASLRQARASIARGEGSVLTNAKDVAAKILKSKAKSAAKSKAKQAKVTVARGTKADAEHDAWLKRNWAVLEPTLIEAQAQIARGEGIAFNSFEEAAAYFIAQGRQRRTRRK